ncbi:hypothetical protein [Planococcus sp. S3-L1]|uniref:hypothetical protein n=1 Tax=Planococcus sp. S3-L1 TaxID=3046200 RepID=UPI0024BAADF0|nr:hypothetical protein [Planococcus sp. S3-L1]MDJ0333573.1 hypothetical protein [Planococcus sp. S3-L1]
MEKLYNFTQVVIAILFFAMIMSLNNSSLLVNIFGTAGIIVSSFYWYLYIKIKKNKENNSSL